MYLLLYIQLLIYREAVHADVSGQFMYNTAVNLPHGHSYDNYACKLIMKEQKYLIKHEFAIMQQVELYKYINSAHSSPLLDDTGLLL